MKTALRNLTRRFVTPYPPADVPAGVFMAPSDVEIFNSSFEQNEALFAASPRLVRQGEALSTFFNDARGAAALKKAVHVAAEQRRRILAYRRSPPSDHGYSDSFVIPKGAHPLDAALSGARRTSALGRLRLYLAVLIRAVLLAAEAALIERRYGRGSLAPERTAVGAPWPVFTQNWDAFRRAAEDAGVWRDGETAVIFDTSAASAAVKTPSWMRRIDAWRLPVERKAWRAEVSRPARRLAWASVRLASAGFEDAWALQAAAESLSAARESFIWRRTAANVRFDWVLDVEEYSPRHIVKSIVLNAAGARTARWPHAIVDAPGAVFSYLCYDLFLSSGPDAAESYGFMWHDVRESASTGFIRNDRRVDQGKTVDPVCGGSISRRLAAGERMLVYFLPSAISGRESLVEETLRVIASVIAGRPGWFLAVKPKSARSSLVLDKILKNRKDLNETLLRLNAVVARIGADGYETCPSGWLLDRMHAGVGVTSVLVEGLTRKLPMVSYWPVRQYSRFQRRLSEEGLIFHESGAFASGLSRVLDGGANISYGWFQSAFDPYADDCALARVARRLLGNDPAALEAPGTTGAAGAHGI